MAIPKGARVRQIVPAIEGEVAERRFSEASNGMEYLVPFVGADGEPGERWFPEAALEVLEEAQ